jgi:cation-dependent mannose-6-phosphate receptor
MRSWALLLPVLACGVLADDTDTPATTVTTAVPVCTAISSTGSGAFFDLRPDIAVAPLDSKSSPNFRGQQQQPPPPPSGSQPTTDYRARGWDYGMNFTLNICGAVTEPIRDVVGVDEKLWQNVSAYYTTPDGDKISIGQQSMDLVSRGRKLVLQYVNGSPCDKEKSHDSDKKDDDDDDDKDQDSRLRKRTVSDKSSSHELASHSYSDLNDEPETEATDYEPMDRHSESNPASKSSASYASSLKSSKSKSSRRKSSVISFHCDRDPSLKQAAVSFVGTPDNCAYFFEVRSQHACARAEPDKPGSVGPGGVFTLILSIAAIVYVLGGVFYNRTVAHARGWRQLPNYSLWAGIWNAFSGVVLVLLSWCARLLPGRRGYRHISSSPSSRDRDHEAENRLIDQLDEEWDD